MKTVKIQFAGKWQGITPDQNTICYWLKKNGYDVQVTEDADYINKAAKAFLDANPEPVSAEKLSELHIAPRKRVLSLMFACVSDVSLESVHINALCSLLENEKNGAAISLPGEYKAQLIDGTLVFSKDKKSKGSPQAPQYLKCHP